MSVLRSKARRLAAGAVGISLAWGSPANAQTVDVRIAGESARHVYHGPFAVEVDLVGNGLLEQDTFQAIWVDPWGRPFSRAFPLTAGQPTVISPGWSLPGHPALRIYPPESVSLGGHPKGMYRDYGFSILPEVDPPQRDLKSQLGTIQLYDNDNPYFRGFVKRSSWKWSPSKVLQQVRDVRAAGREDVLLIYGEPFDSNDFEPIPASQLDQIGDRVGAIFDEFSQQGESPLVTVQAGLEVNGGDILAEPYFLSNFAKKLKRVRSEIDQRGLPTDVAVSTRGFSSSAIKEVKAIFDGEAGKYADRLSHSIYDFDGGWRMPLEDGWLAKAIGQLAAATQGAPKKIALDLGEFGACGNNHPDLVLGYPDKSEPNGKKEVASLSPFDHARFLVESTVVTLATNKVERFFLYHHQDNVPYEDDEPIWYAEKYFGTAAWGGRDPASGDHLPGHPFPSATAMATLHQRIGLHAFREHRSVGDVQVFEFDPRPETGATEGVLALWVHPDGSREVSLAELREGLGAANVIAVENLFGTPLHLRDPMVVSETPLWLRFDRGEAE